MNFGPDTSSMVAAFSAQFESDSKGGYLYRHGEQGAAIPVTAAERDRFVATFERQSRRWLLGLLVATTAAIIATVIIATALHLNQASRNVTIAAMVVVLVAAILMWSYRAYDMPRRALASRASTGIVRSREEARKIARKRQSWGQILGVFTTVVMIVAAQALRHDVLHGWGRLWLLFLAFGIVGSGYAAIRKWQAQIG